ncbi:hypothetical protein D3C84_1036760 [compost metagenome]
MILIAITWVVARMLNTVVVRLPRMPENTPSLNATKKALKRALTRSQMPLSEAVMLSTNVSKLKLTLSLVSRAGSCSRSSNHTSAMTIPSICRVPMAKPALPAALAVSWRNLLLV